jgi:AraC family L-rhamnose operon transcriptional activator RhaR/AraC family L-rhamnose operon regulatory protein RhaS
MTQRISARKHFATEHDFCNVRIQNLISGYPPHSHDYIEIVVVLAGHVEHCINKKTYSVSSGDVYVLQGRQEHGFQKPTKDFRIINVMYRPEIFNFPLDKLRTMPGYQALFVLEPAKRSDSEFRSLLRLDSARLKEVLEKVQRLQHEMKMRSPGFDCISQAYLLELIVFLSRLYSKSSESSTSDLLRFSEAVAWMEENYAKLLSVPALARRAAMSNRHFFRMFKKIFHIPPLEHIIQLRIRHAAELLESRSNNITETAFKCGFSDGNYFSKQFRRIMGVSPRQYRKATDKKTV